MHDVSMPPEDPNQPRELNPYEHVVSILASTLAAFDDDQLIPAYGFGDVSATQRRSGASRTADLYDNYRLFVDLHNELASAEPFSLSLLCALVCMGAVEHQVRQGVLVL